MKRARVDVNNKWGAAIGYSRAVRAGNIIVVSGTSASGPDGALHPGDAEQQTIVVLQRIGAALHELDASIDDIVETRIFLRNMSDWEAVGKAHGSVFGAIRPATTMVQAGALIDESLLVEIAATAILAS
ncbi:MULTISPECIES: RidA family protein [Mesorhizobium]|uniref:Enamine deaminase RidA (YjgF/YER057c/UK114 family) n=1 Tax=Rhizobium loti TaxID=381 RepID=A0A8E2WIX9_RHILI|nr:MULTISPECIES: RidA family protein [Mesorhizobium]PWJ93804.1 enamine deaminase RidA (YjgF/YER057c/UK114 family) [Mesorhizobium loti]QKC86149.1 RidA family protein [Mesorhizobium sp. NZP2077]QKD15646.1 RidA family protein [Mesorhizobium sp. NZP2077]